MTWSENGKKMHIPLTKKLSSPLVY